MIGHCELGIVSNTILLFILIIVWGDRYRQPLDWYRGCGRNP